MDLAKNFTILSAKENHSSFENAKKTLQDSKKLIERLSSLKQQMEISLSGKTKEQPLLKKSTSSNGFETAYKPKLEQKTKDQKNKSKIEYIRQNVVGFNTEYISAFNIKLESVYVDHTATNRPYRPVENMIEYAKTLVANPHTEFSYYGKYSTEMMHYSQKSLLKSFSADPDLYVALPTGSGSTGAIQKAIKMLKTVQKPDQKKPDVFLTPYEHHSNILPWIEFYDNVKVLEFDNETDILDMEKILEQLKNWENDFLIVSVSAASNVTSQVTDLKSLNAIIKKARQFKTIVFAVDCAAYVCHKELNLKILDQIDFVFLSPHKNLGGAESCGVLVARKSIVKGPKPTFPGGGTVAFVKGYNKEDVLYDEDIFNREIPGTPPFLGFYRAALSFELLKNHIGYDFIDDREKQNTKLFIKLINEQNETFIKEKIPASIVIYGSQDFSKRANVITMNLYYDNEVVQHSFASLILADAFGIQLRSGCFCAGPFGMQLLKVDPQTAERLSSVVSVGILKQKPGYLRLDLTFYLEKFEIEYLAYAIGLTARYVKKMLMVYTICNDGEIKRHKLFKHAFEEKFSLSNSNLAEESIRKNMMNHEEKLKNRKETLEGQLNQGKAILMDPLQFLKSQMNKQVLKKI